MRINQGDAGATPVRRNALTVVEVGPGNRKVRYSQPPEGAGSPPERAGATSEMTASYPCRVEDLPMR